MSFAVPDDGVLVADGGLATELEARGNDLSDSLWSARLLMDAPDQIRDAHLAFFRAGAVIATLECMGKGCMCMRVECMGKGCMCMRVECMGKGCMCMGVQTAHV